MSEYFTAPDDVSAGSRARAGKINEIIANITAGFDALPAGLVARIAELVAARDGEDTLLDQIDSLQALIAALTAGNSPLTEYLASRFVMGTGLAASNTETELTLTADLTSVSKTETGTLSVADVSNRVINNYGQGAEMTLTLPAAADGYGFLLQVGTTGHAIHIKAGAGDKIYLDGTALNDADKISLAVPVVGDYVTVWTLQTGEDTFDWIADSGPNYWTDGGA
jgi:hypothetical protein